MPAKGFKVLTVRDADMVQIETIKQDLVRQWLKAKRYNPTLKRPSKADVISRILMERSK